MRIQLLYFDGCPNHETLVPKLRAILAAEGVAEEVELRRVESLEAAERERFLGSPTVRINGEDIEPGAGERIDFGLKCRLFRSDAGVSGVPPEEWITTAIRARAKPSSPRPSVSTQS